MRSGTTITTGPDSRSPPPAGRRAVPVVDSGGHRVLAGLLALGAAGAAWHAPPAAAQQATTDYGIGPTTPDLAPPPQPFVIPPSVLPATGYGGNNGSGTSVRPGDLRQQIEQSFQPAGGGKQVTGPAWQITPSLGLTEELTDNAAVSGADTGSGKQGDLISTLQPGLAVSGDTQRLQVNLWYTPNIYIYAREGNQDRVAQDFNGRALATLIPQTLFLDLRGFGSEQAIFGGRGPNTIGTLPSNEAGQNYSFSATPYLVHRFGTLGTGEIGYSIEQTVQTGSETFGVSPNFALSPLFPVPSNQRTTTQNAHAAFVTGEALGRYNGTALASVTHFDGQGVLANAHRDIFSIDNGYAITRTITLLATGGYENIQYAGTAPLHISDAIWDFGARLTPNADTTLTVRYGHHDGADSLTVDGALAPSPRTRVYVRYSSGLTTGQELLQNALATTDLDALGNPIDHTTGAPVFVASNFFGLQNSLSRLRRLSLSGAYMLDRDTVTATVESDDYKVLSSPGPPGGPTLGSNSGTYGSLTWLHQLSPRLISSLYVQYGERSLEGPPSATQDLLVGSASLAYALGPNLSSTLQVSHQESTGGGSAAGLGSGSQSVLLLSILKTF